MGTMTKRLLLGLPAVALLGPLLAVGLGAAPPAGADVTSFSITANATSSAAIVDGSAATLAETGLPVAATGTVTFTTSLSVTLCVATLPASQCITPVSLSPGTYPVTATYSGDGTYGSSSSSNSVSLTGLGADEDGRLREPDCCSVGLAGDLLGGGDLQLRCPDRNRSLPDAGDAPLHGHARR